MSRESHKAIERVKKIASMSLDEQRAYLESEKRGEPASDSAGSRAAQCYAARLEDQLRVELYNAACEYAREVDKPMGNWEAISAAADKLEVAAQNFILRSAA